MKGCRISGAIHTKRICLCTNLRQTGAVFFSAFSKSARLFFQSGILAIGAWLAINQEISVGTIIAAAIILSRGLAPIEQLLMNWRDSTAAFHSYNRIKSVALHLSNPGLKTQLPPPDGKLVVKELSCLAPNSKQVLVRNINFQLDAGETLGIVGPSGVGKSTLLKAIIGIWPDTKGEIRLDGATFDQWERSELAKYLGYVPQDISLITGSIAQNISRFSPEASSDLIIEAAKLAQVHDMIVGLPLGYNTIVGPGGMSLSAGQRQRVALARAFYGKPRLIVLDEPNSNLDVSGDQALINAIKAMQQLGSTIIVATHRPSALADVQKVLVLHNGGQAAFGPKDEIINMPSAKPLTIVAGGVK